jgi:hypothetical protein
MGKTFDSTHRHQLTTNGTSFTLTHAEAMIGHVKTPRVRNHSACPVHLPDVPGRRRGVRHDELAGRVAVGGVTPKYDVIVSNSAPAFLTAEHVEGTKPPADYHGRRCLVRTAALSWFIRTSFPRAM